MKKLNWAATLVLAATAVGAHAHQDMDHAARHDEPHMIHVKPGATGEIVWNFNRPGEFDFACLVAGHDQAGMAGKVQVIPKESKR